MKTDLTRVLAISGQSGLFHFVSQSRTGVIVEGLADKKRTNVAATGKVTSLADISIYTDEEEVPLRKVFKNIYDMEGGKPTTINYRKASNEELADFMAKALPNYDRDHVYPSDMKKLIQWYNILVENGVTDFEAPQQEEAESAE